MLYEKVPADFEGDFAALSTPRGWQDQVWRLNRIGIDRAGALGDACPRCWLPTAAHGGEHRAFGNCQCEDATISDALHVLRVHGLESLGDEVFFNWTGPL